jgi:hypothetical protein
LSKEKDDRASVPERGVRAKLSDVVERRIDGTGSPADNPVVRTLRQESEILAQESNFLTLKQLVDEKKKAVAQASSMTAITPQVQQQFQMTPEVMKMLVDLPEDQREKLMGSVMLMNARAVAENILPTPP